MVPAPIPYPPIARHGLIGDRRTAALVAADGTLDWLCLPDYGDDPLFCALLDAANGGFCQLGPRRRMYGRQCYREDTATLETRFGIDGGELLLRDVMLDAGDERSPSTAHARVVVRHLVAARASIECRAAVIPARVDPKLSVYCSRGAIGADGIVDFALNDGEEAWLVLAYDSAEAWDETRARDAVIRTERELLAWCSRLTCRGDHAALMRRSLLTIHLLAYAPLGSVVAAPTTSLPERIGGDWNADYRLSWVRDGSLTTEMLATHHDPAAACRYFDWLCSLKSSTNAPLQTVYGIDGDTRPKARVQKHLPGYRNSTPVRFGNDAFRQSQLGSFGYLVHCASVFKKRGGGWKPHHFELIARAADYTAEHWREKDRGIWELDAARHHVSSRVMSWVALARASELAEALGEIERAARWQRAAADVHDEVLARGYSETRRAFRQEYDSDALDASTLLIPIMGFLPADDPRVCATVKAIAEELTIEGHVHRFMPTETPGASTMGLAEHEGSFILCTAWLATAYARMGEVTRAEETLARIRPLAGDLGLFAEGVDARSGELRGNYPLLFTHAEYVRAEAALHTARAAA